MNDDLLRALNLEPKEAHVYEVLLTLGETTTGPLCKESGIPSAHIYPLLERLTELGLVSWNLQRGTKKYSAADPQALKTRYEEERKKFLQQQGILEQAIQSLRATQTVGQPESEIRVYEGVPGVKTAVEQEIKKLVKGDTYTVIGAPIIGNARLNAFFKDAHKLRRFRGARYCGLYSKDAEQYAKERSKDSTAEVYLLSAKTRAEIVLTPRAVQIVCFEHPPTVVEIRRDDVVETIANMLSIFKKTSEEEYPHPKAQ